MKGKVGKMAILKRPIDLQRHYGCNPRTLRTWRLFKNFPGGEHGPWDTDKVDVFLAARNSPLVKKNGESAHGTISDTNEIKAQATAELAQEKLRQIRMQNDIVAGKLADRKELEAAHNESLVMIKNRLESFPDELCKLVSVGERAILHQEAEEFIRRLLIEMSHWEDLAA